MNNDEQCCYSASCPPKHAWSEEKKENAALDSAENAESKQARDVKKFWSNFQIIYVLMGLLIIIS